MISGAGDKILKRWPLPVHSFVPTLVLGKEVSEVLHLAVSHNVRAHDKDINTLAVSPNDAMAASGTLPSHHISLHRTPFIRKLSLAPSSNKQCSSHVIPDDFFYAMYCQPTTSLKYTHNTPNRSLTLIYPLLPNLWSRFSRQNHPVMADLGPRSNRLSLRAQERHLEGCILTGRPMPSIMLW